MIHLDGAGKVYPRAAGDVQALAGASLHVDEGEFVAVRGPSGCGKSTLLALAGGLTLPTSGRVVVAGRDLSALSPGERAAFRAEKIGFVFQMFHLLPYLSVLDNVLVAAAPAAGGGVRQSAEELLSRFDLGDRLSHRPGELSAGERQRVAMARAMLNRPALLLADEPTGNLDPKNADALLELILQFNQDGGTVLLATHDERAAGRAGRTILMEKGRIAEGKVAARASS